MSTENFAFFYFVTGILICFLNGFVRKIEADALLGFTWFLLWPLTPIGYTARGIEWVYNTLKHYQPLRRLRIYYLRNF